MTILVTGSTGVIGSQVVANLAEKGAGVHALTCSPEGKIPARRTPVKADLMDKSVGPASKKLGHRLSV
jgi:nucleoside-diphosphate-sugar epimerase